MALSASDRTKIGAVIESFLGGSERFTNEEIDLAMKATFGDLVVEFGMDANKARKFENMMTLNKKRNARPGFNVNRLSEAKMKRIIREETEAIAIDLSKTGVKSDYHPVPKGGGGLSFEDSDPHEEAGMIKSNLSSIASKAQSLHDMVGDTDDLPEWVQEKIAVADEMIDVIHDYLSYEYKRGKK